MDPAKFAPALRVLTACLHLLVACLLMLAALRAVLDTSPYVTGIVAAVVLTAAVYTGGAVLSTFRHSTLAAAAWLAVLSACWLVLLALAADGAWLAFPLFFLQLHLLPRRIRMVVVAATTLATILGFAWHQHTLTVGTVVGPALGAAVAVATVLGYEALHRESEQRRSLIEDLVATRAELAAAERHAGTLGERERLAREIHDTLAQGLSSIVLLLRAADRAMPRDAAVAAAREHIDRATTTAGANLAEARRFVRALTQPDLEHGSLAAALHRLCESGSSGATMTFRRTGTPVELPTPVEVALLRIAQSAVSNVERHAVADRVEVTLSYFDGAVAVDVVDDGRGFEPDRALSDGTASDRAVSGSAVSGSVEAAGAASEGGFGVSAMRTRAAELGGTMSVESAPGKGCAVAVTFPLERECRGDS
ncbi:sensor histidine kinase [Haloactinomyces albus]|uniref:Signal transduction histidine kinase n=1 Tax=Haloactinomyces albus TaxID=1352928 RepID=A0AAE4CPB7_9ACTN|nr:sensor histidine kinase [Haloactinomyces albus]MDR7302952.1 signal transduction histidine kinase [Haloactinomyces albus]